MDIQELLNNKSKKPKEKTEILCAAVASKEISVNELLDFAAKSKDPVKATCIEALEFATKQDQSVADKAVFSFVTESLSAKAPRVKWESAKVIGNTASLFKKDLDAAISKLLVNTEDEGTVVRWSAAYALGEILKLNTAYNTDLVPAVKAIAEREEKNSIKKIYIAALKKVK